MMNFMNQSKKEIDDLGDRVEHVENKMCDFTEAHNKLVDAHFDVENEIKNLKLKVADLEDKSRRNNIKF